jgi:hypothetical protein
MYCYRKGGDAGTDSDSDNKEIYGKINVVKVFIEVE